jgi:Tfp pilus assembly protein FimV
MSPQEMNIEKQKEKEKEMRQKMREQQQQMQEMQQKIQRQQQSSVQVQMPVQVPVASKPSFYNPPTMGEPRKTISEIRVPDSVRTILNRIKTDTTFTGTFGGTSDTQDSASNNERLLSVENVSESKKGKKKNVSIPSISINT